MGGDFVLFDNELDNFFILKLIFFLNNFVLLRVVGSMLLMSVLIIFGRCNVCGKN